MYYGSSSLDNAHKEEVVEFFREVARGVESHLAGRTIPMILAGLPEWVAVYREIGSYPHLLEAFPFPHLVEIEATLVEGSLEVQTSLTATGAVAVPISFGFHPYLTMPGVLRAEWVLEAPVHERLVLGRSGLPTGEREPIAIEPGPLGERTYDDAFLAPSPGTAFALVGPDRRIELRMDSGYPFTQIYAPPDLDAVAIEPMTAPTNALLTAGPELTFVPPRETFTASFSISVL